MRLRGGGGPVWAGRSRAPAGRDPRHAQGSSSMGRKVTDAVICRMMAWISCVISFSDLERLALHKTTQRARSAVSDKTRRRRSPTRERAARGAAWGAHPFSTTSRSVSTLNTHRSKVSLVSVPVTTMTSFWTSPRCNHSGPGVPQGAARGRKRVRRSRPRWLATPAGQSTDLRAGRGPWTGRTSSHRRW